MIADPVGHEGGRQCEPHGIGIGFRDQFDRLQPLVEQARASGFAQVRTHRVPGLRNFVARVLAPRCNRSYCILDRKTVHAIPFHHGATPCRAARSTTVKSPHSRNHDPPGNHASSETRGGPACAASAIYEDQNESSKSASRQIFEIIGIDSNSAKDSRQKTDKCLKTLVSYMSI